MPRILSHQIRSSLELRDDDGAGDGRTLIGRAVPFDVELDVWDFWDDYTEVFRRGAFAKTIRDRAKPVPLLVHHNRRELGIGKAVDLEERDDGLWAAFHLAATERADEVLELVREDVISGLSIGFEPIDGGDRTTRGKDREPPADTDLVERLEVRLHEVSICNFPAYDTAGVSAVRSARSAAAGASAGRHPSLASLAAERDRLEVVRSAALDRWGRVGAARMIPAGLRPLVVIGAAVALLVLGFVVLAGHPANEVDLLAWADVAAGAGFVALVTRP